MSQQLQEPSDEDALNAVKRLWDVQHTLRDNLESGYVPPLFIHEQVNVLQEHCGQVGQLFSHDDIRTAAALSSELYSPSALEEEGLLATLRGVLELHEDASVEGAVLRSSRLPCGWLCCPDPAGVRKDKTLFIGWRGSQDLKDLFTNLDWRPRPVPGLDRTSVSVHSGFWSMFDDMKREFEDLICDVEPSRIVLCGHSLGGAVAAVAHLAMVAAPPQGRRWAWWHMRSQPVALHALTFGAPSAFIFHENPEALQIRQKVTNSAANLFFEWDVVPRLPACQEFAVAAVRACMFKEVKQLSVRKRLYLSVGGLPDKLLALLQHTLASEPDMQKYTHASRLIMCQAAQLEVCRWKQTGGWWEWRELDDAGLRGLSFPDQPDQALNISLKDHLLLPFRYLPDWRRDHCSACFACVTERGFVDCYGCQQSTCGQCFNASARSQAQHLDPNSVADNFPLHKHKARSCELFSGCFASLPSTPRYLNLAELREETLKTQRLAISSISHAWNLWTALFAWEPAVLSGCQEYQRLQLCTDWASSVAEAVAHKKGTPGTIVTWDPSATDLCRRVLKREQVPDVAAALQEAHAKSQTKLASFMEECTPAINQTLLAARTPHQLATYYVKATLAWNCFFAAGECLYAAYLSWGDGNMDWLALMSRISGVALKTLTRIGATYVGAMMGGFIAGLINPVIGPYGAAAGAFVSQLVSDWASAGVGEKLCIKVSGGKTTDETDNFNAEALIQAMFALQLDGTFGGERLDPYTLTGRALKTNFREVILKVHPDKLVQHANESPEDFVERLKQEEGKAKMYIHHYQILSVFLANRDAPCWAQRKDLIQKLFQKRVKQHRASCGLSGL